MLRRIVKLSVIDFDIMIEELKSVRWKKELLKENSCFSSNFFSCGNKKLPDRTGLNKRFVVEWTDWPFDITDILGLVQFTAARLLQIAPSPQNFQHIVPEKRARRKCRTIAIEYFFSRILFIYLFNSFFFASEEKPFRRSWQSIPPTFP